MRFVARSLMEFLISNSVFQTDVESLPRYKDGAPFSDLEIVQCAWERMQEPWKVEADQRLAKFADGRN